MSKIERVGAIILAVVFTTVVAIFLVHQFRYFQARGGDPDADLGWWARRLLAAVWAPIALALVGRGLWRGHEGIRRLVSGFLAVVGVGVVAFAIWMTTLDWPNAASPEERAEMKADAQRQLPWRIGQGVALVVMGGLMLLPPVKHFLNYRRLALAEPGSVSGRDLEARPE